MIRGTTPTHSFTLPFDSSLLHSTKILYGQQDEVLIEKRDSDLTKNGKTIKLTLTQEETFLFKDNIPVQIQVRALTTGQEAVSTPILLVSVEKCLDDEVLM